MQLTEESGNTLNLWPKTLFSLGTKALFSLRLWSASCRLWLFCYTRSCHTYKWVLDSFVIITKGVAWYASTPFSYHCAHYYLQYFLEIYIWMLQKCARQWWKFYLSNVYLEILSMLLKLWTGPTDADKKKIRLFYLQTDVHILFQVLFFSSRPVNCNCLIHSGLHW